MTSLTIPSGIDFCDFKFVKHMEKIRFTEQIVNLHQRMCSAIYGLMVSHGLERMSFVGDETADVYYDYDGFVARERVDFIVIENQKVKLHLLDADCEEESWEYIGLSSEVVYCTIDTVYNCLYKAIETCCYPVHVVYDSTKYALRRVQPRDVGLDIKVEDGYILIGPKSLAERLEADNATGNFLDEQIYYFTDDENLSLSYPLLCQKLKEEGMD